MTRAMGLACMELFAVKSHEMPLTCGRRTGFSMNTRNRLRTKSVFGSCRKLLINNRRSIDASTPN